MNIAQTDQLRELRKPELRLIAPQPMICFAEARSACLRAPTRERCVVFATLGRAQRRADAELHVAMRERERAGVFDCQAQPQQLADRRVDTLPIASQQG